MVEQIESLDEIDLESKFVVVEEDRKYPDQLVFQALDQKSLVAKYRKYLSRYNVLLETGLWQALSSELERDGYTIYLMPSAQRVIEWNDRMESGLSVEGLELKKKDGTPSDLFAYQMYGLNKALDEDKDFFFFNWGTGTGKTIAGVAGGLELINRGKIDIILTYTLSQVKHDFTNAFNANTNRKAVLVSGPPKKRRETYRDNSIDMFVLNYEKARKTIDLEPLLELVENKRVLFVFDEVQQILNPNTARQGVDELIAKADRSIVWPMSASLVKGDPERFWRTFEWMKVNPLGTLKDFRDRYVKSVYRRQIKIKTKHGGVFSKDMVEYVYDQNKLAEIQHRVAPWSHAVRKTDPGVREFFKDMQFVPIELEMSKEDKKVYNHIVEEMKEEKTNLMQYSFALRAACLTSESLKYTTNEIAKRTTEMPFEFSAKNSVKLERVLSDIEEIREGGDKCIVFTHWREMSLEILSREMKKRKIKHVVHHGGMKDSAREKAKSDFKTKDDITVLISSDAGSHGMNMQEARVVINYDTPYDYDTLMQRNDRIHRADSYLDGLEARVYFYKGSIEEKIWKENNRRRKISAATQGTEESLDRGASAKTEFDLLKELEYIL